MQLTGGTIAVVATGEMGSAVAATLLAAGLQVVTSLDGRSQRTRELAVAAGVPDVGSLAAVVREARVFLSIVPTAAARPLAEAVAGVLPAATAGGFTYVDCNATSPQTAAGIGRLIEAAGARFVDASIIGSPPRGGPPVSIWLAGEHAGEVRAMLACAGIDPQVAGGEVGQASAVKMCYAAITKGLAALATESFTAAARAGLAEHVESSLLRHQPGLLALVTDMVTGAPPKAHRWVAEMEEIAATMAATGLPAASFTGAAQLYALVAATALGAETPEGRQQRSLGAVAAELASHTARDHRRTGMEQIPRVVRFDQLSDQTAQTPGFIRRAAIDAAMTGASRIDMYWFDDLGGPKRSACHTHGEAETAVYCISGRQRVYFGEGFTRFIEFGAGDFAYIPAFLPHIEVNPWSEPCVCVGARSPANIVENLPDDLIPSHLAELLAGGAR